ncbi:uncharacterized protein LOC131948373 [Physella acuta]|uniref:uncharacterized protein LOC131948373 n=1 Tax=Physella acuta TaxID=109671 RepID=UPI0027DCAB92|nr:uncharacterized protein LOC131948373 [Physella acuta]
MAQLEFLFLIFVKCLTVQVDVLAADEMSAKIAILEGIVDSLGKQLMQNQLFVEERVRSDGESGIKKVRLYHEGTRPYFADTHVAQSAIAIHDHADYDRTLGLGEFIGVLNGVEFRTRHNDYKLKMSSTTSTRYHEIEDITLPTVPPEVLHKPTLQEQVVEMREWFRAFKEQNYTVRDYRPYFKPVLCSIEGAWTLAKDIEEPFPSDRHHLDATSWADLAEKISFTSYTGAKHNLENFAFLPSKMYAIENGVPQFAQWNYRVICTPLSFDLPTSYFKMEDDIAHRLAYNVTLKQASSTRSARFTVNEHDKERKTTYTMLDRMMHELPGLNNYKANITDMTYGLIATDIGQPGQVPLNAGFYHRWYQYNVKGAMGDYVNHKGYNDETLWVAINTQPNIMPLSTSYCNQTNCVRDTRRVSFAIPLEVIYLTPVLSWNPNNVAYYPGDPKTDLLAQSVVANGRNGGTTKETAFNGTNRKTYYRTPISFYASTDVEPDSADTARGSAGVLDKNGNVHLMAASGPRIITPDIQGVGTIRLRYPIFPVHEEGSTVGRELSALKEIVTHLFVDQPPVDEYFSMSESNQNPPGLHTHSFVLSAADYASLLSGTDATVKTSTDLGHYHELKVHYDSSKGTYTYVTCDGLDTCRDGHGQRIIKQE